MKFKWVLGLFLFATTQIELCEAKTLLAGDLRAIQSDFGEFRFGTDSTTATIRQRPERDYIAVSLCAERDHRLELSSIRVGGHNSGGFWVSSSVDGFGSKSPLQAVSIGGREGNGWVLYLEDQEYDSVKDVEFRIYPLEPNAQDGLLTIEELVVDGEVVVAPEPASFTVWALILSLVFGFALLAKRVLAAKERGFDVDDRRTWSTKTRLQILAVIEKGLARDSQDWQAASY